MADGNNYSGSSNSYGNYTSYTTGNSSNRYGDTEYFNDGEVGQSYGEVTYFTKSGGHSVRSGDVTTFYNRDGYETGRCVHNGNNRTYYGDCGPCTSDVDK